MYHVHNYVAKFKHSQSSGKSALPVLLYMSVGEWDEVGARVVYIGTIQATLNHTAMVVQCGLGFSNYGNVPSRQWPLTQSGANISATLPVDSYMYDTEESTLDVR